MPSNLETAQSVLIHHLADAGCVKSMKIFLSIFPSRKDQLTLLNLPGYFTRTPCSLAASTNRIEMVKVRCVRIIMAKENKNTVSFGF